MPVIFSLKLTILPKLHLHIVEENVIHGYIVYWDIPCEFKQRRSIVSSELLSRLQVVSETCENKL